MSTDTKEMSSKTEDVSTEAPSLPPDRLALISTDKDWHFEVLFDLADSTYGTHEKHQSENSVSFYQYHGHAVGYTLPKNVDAVKFEAWIAEDVMPVLNRIQAGYSSEYDGRNTVAKFTDDAVEAKEALNSLFEGGWDSQVPVLDAQTGGFWEADDWLGESKAVVIKENNITASSSDADLRAAADSIDDIARNEDIVLDGTYKFLYYLRQGLIEDQE